jgi:lysophospholipase L1-like esterase
MRWLPSALFRRARPTRPQPYRNTYRPSLEPLENRLAPAGVASYPTSLDFSQGFAAASGPLALNGAAQVRGSLLQLTDGGAGEASSAFTASSVDVTHFTTHFRFELLNAWADGFTFTLEGVGPHALGGSGGWLGYAPAPGTRGIPNSVAVKFDLYNNQGEGNNSTGLYQGGAVPTTAGSIDLGRSGINLHSGHGFDVGMAYDGTTLKVAITDIATNVTATQTYLVNIPAAIGGGKAYVGFTAGTGGLSATQDILNWTYAPTLLAPLPPTGLQASAGARQVFLRWTPSPGSFSYNVYRSVAGGSPTLLATGVAGSSFTDTGVVAGATYSYQLTAVGIAGEGAPSAQASVTDPALSIDFSSGFGGAGLGTNGSATVTGSRLRLTDGRAGEAGSAFTAQPVDVTRFATQFTFQLSNAFADGFTFTIQGAGPRVLGGSGGNLGYAPALAGTAGVPESAAVNFRLYNYNGETGNSTGLHTSSSPGASASWVDLGQWGINLHNGHRFVAAITDDGATLNVALTDTVTGAMATQSYTVNIPALVGGTAAYVGFTGGTGGLTAIQDVVSWVYSPLAGNGLWDTHLPAGASTTPTPRDAAWLARHNQFVSMAARGNTNVLLLGDSITDWWGGEGHSPTSAGTGIFQSDFGPLGATNFGIAGDQTQNLLWRLQNGEMAGIAPKVVMLMIGTNNFGIGVQTPQQVAAGVNAVVNEIHKWSPGTKVLLLGILPRGQSPADPFRAEIRQANALISALDDGGKTVKYLDIGSKFLQPDGSISPAIMPDFLHPSAQGYQIWANAVMGPIQQLLSAS